MASREAEAYWHLDKRVPVALIITMASWIATTIWWASALDNRVEVLEKMALKNQGVETRLVRIEEGQDWLKKGMERLLNSAHNGE